MVRILPLRASPCRRVRLFALWVLFAGSFYQPAPLAAVQFNGTAHTDLRRIAAQLGMQTRWLVEGKRMELHSEWTRMEFTRDRREIRINGTQVHLGFPIAEHQGRLYLSDNDFQHHFRPILTPQVFGSPPPLRHIVIDAGHGGNDPGAENRALGLREKSLVLDLARRLQKRLLADGYRVSLTRPDDTFLPLGERSRMANALGADLFLSLHFNASVKADVSGVETFAFTPPYQPSTARANLHSSDRRRYPGNAADPWNTLLGYYVQRSLTEALPVPDRGLKRARFSVLRDLRMPGLLIEGGFLSHAREGRNVGSAAYRDRIAAAIADGLAVYARTASRLKKD
ncbi:MAG: N-acetylmuramoyl-L-alanine amidase [Oceanipulchritudo sp.]